MAAPLMSALALFLLFSPATALAQDPPPCPSAKGVAYAYFGDDSCGYFGYHAKRNWTGYFDHNGFKCQNLNDHTTHGEVLSVYKTKSNKKCAVNFYSDGDCKVYLDGSSISESGCKPIVPFSRTWDVNCILPDPDCQAQA